MKPHLCRICSFVSELYDVKTKRSMICKDLFDNVSTCTVKKKVEAHTFNFYLNKSIGMAANNVFILIFSLKSSLSVNLKQFMIE